MKSLSKDHKPILKKLQENYKVLLDLKAVNPIIGTVMLKLLLGCKRSYTRT